MTLSHPANLRAKDERGLFMPGTRREVLQAVAAASAYLAWPRPAAAQASATADWLDPAHLAAAKAEGAALVVYSSINEQEGLPAWKYFEDATGIKVNYVRGSDVNLISKVMIEARTQQKSWDIMISTGAGRLPQDLLTPFEPTEAAAFPDEAKDKARRWYGLHATYNAPSFNSALVRPEQMPKTYEEIAARKEWAGRIAIDATDTQWLGGMIKHYGEAGARKLLGEIVTNLKPVLTEGHLNLARQVGAGEFMVTLNNYVSLTTNVKQAGGPSEFWLLDPVVLFFEQLGISVRAPHPKTALFAANFLMSRDGQQQTTRGGRTPVRRDVVPIPADLFAQVDRRKVIPVTPTGEEDRQMKKIFDEIFRGR